MGSLQSIVSLSMLFGFAILTRPFSLFATLFTIFAHVSRMTATTELHGRNTELLAEEATEV